MKMKKFIAVIVSTCIAICFIAGCSVTHNSNNNNSNTNNDVSENCYQSISIISEKDNNKEVVENIKEYKELSKKYDVEIYDTSNLTLEVLQNRNGKIIIEKRIGIVENENGDGKTLNDGNNGKDNFYTNYSNVKNVNKGNVILTYFVYNPCNNSTDDIVYRYDRIIA